MAKTLKLCIDGQWREGGDGEVMPVVNPATEEVIASLCLASAADLDDVLESAQRGFEVWRSVSPAERAAHIRGVASLLRRESSGLQRR